MRKPAAAPVRSVPPPAIRDRLNKAGGELSRLVSEVRSCSACGRCADGPAVFGSGSPAASVLLLKEHPGEEDLATGTAFASEAGPLTKALDRLGIPLSSVYGTCVVRCGPAPASSDDIRACSAHLLTEIEAVAPRVLVAFGPRVVEAVRALDGRCGISVPEEPPRGQPVPLRPGLVMLWTEPLPQGVRATDAKKRLWADLQVLPGLVGTGR